MMITKLWVLLDARKGYVIQWGARGLLAGDTVIIERASGPEGPWEELDRKSAADTLYIDEVAPRRGFHDHLYYRVLLERAGEVIQTTEPMSMDHRAGLLQAEVIRQHQLLLYGVRAHPGVMSRAFACFKRSIGGIPCPYCLDKVTGEIILDDCPHCAGARKLSGWSNPVLFRARFIDPEQRMHTLGITEDADEVRSLFMANYPVLEPGDVLLERSTGKRFRVITNVASVPGNVITSQSPQIKRLRGDFTEQRLQWPEGREI